MSLDAVSAWVAINHRTLPNPANVCYSFGFNEAIPAAGPSIHLYSNKWRRVMHLKHRIHVKQSLDAVWLPARGRGNLSPRTLAFTKPNESNEGERGLSYDCMESQVSMPSENGEGYNNSDLEADDVLSHLEDNSSIGGYLSDLGLLLDKLKSIPLHLLASEQWNASRLKSCHRNHVPSATNLIHYLAMKFFLDIDQLKQDHPCMGLFNLEAINSCILPSLTVAIQSIENDARSDNQETLQKQKSAMMTIHKMKKKAISNRDLLLGSLQEDRSTHIMVTVGEEAINSDTLITDLLEAGTSVIRINCAHGDSIIWNEIINRVKRSSQMLEKPCRILMDLAGPKLRTGKLKPGPSVIKISPKKNGNGNVISPAQVWLSYRGAGEPPSHLSPDAVLFIDEITFLSDLEIGDTLRFCDARGKSRDLKVSRRVHFFAGTGYMTECTRTAYVSSGTELRVKRKKGKFLVGQVVDIPAKEQYIKLGVGDLLVISRDSSDEKQYDPSSTTNGTQMVTCPSGRLFNSVKPGEPIAFNDGKLWGVIKANSSSEIVVSITHASRKGTKLGSQKSINIPNSNICFEGLTSKDLMDLEFVAVHADMVGMSFVRDIDDIVVLRQELEKRKLHNLGIVIKIETRGAFENLPLMLLEAMKSPNPLGVMIARGDLAVECGWERLADIQEEILSICDAAHVPVIWATQVLESLVKSGLPTRAEITDVASGKRSSCIMLNKGENIVEAVKFLDTIMCNSSKQMKAKISLVPSSPIFS